MKSEKAMHRLRSPILLSFAFLLFGCSTHVDPKVGAQIGIFLSSLQEASYDTSTASLRLKGRNALLDATEVTTLRFYSDSTCMSAILGEGTDSQFADPGILVSVPSMVKSAIYVNSNTASTCLYLTTYDPLHLAPPVPVFTSFSPASPSRSSSTPRIFGTVEGSTQDLKFYSDASCSVLVGSGIASDFAKIGIPLTLTPNSTSSVYVKAYEPFGNGSPCTQIASFTHSTTGPTIPILASTSPVSPSASVLNPVIIGTVDSITDTVKIFSDAACSTVIASGSKADFTGAGISISVASNSSTGLWAEAFDSGGNPSFCTYLTTYVEDEVAPVAPSYVSANPVSPTNQTFFPKIKGTASADTVIVNFYSDSQCNKSIGSGTKSAFEGPGVNANVGNNVITNIYAKSADAAGNLSTCKFLTDYLTDTIPPDPPVFSGTNPTSPTNKTTHPLVIGGLSSDTVSVRLFSDLSCTTQIGSGTAASFISTGILVNATPNATTNIHAIAYDQVGNGTDCTYLTSFEHSDAVPPAPTYGSSNPTSPTNITSSPFVIGTVASIITQVQFFDDVQCTNLIGSGTARTFKTTGVKVTLTPNQISNLYATSLDKYGNQSVCTFFTPFTHTNIIPSAPSFLSFSPASPTRMSSTPMITGIANNNPSAIIPTSTLKFFDSNNCSNTLGHGTQAAFTTSGIQIQAIMDATTTVYARAYDDAGNGSPCTQMANFTHDTLLPGKPLLTLITPGSPSYSPNLTVFGTIGPNSDILPPTAVQFFSDPTCANPLGPTSPASLFSSVGNPIVVPTNATTSIYGMTTNQVGSTSSCNLLQNFVHEDVGASAPSITANPNGSLLLTWQPDTVANPLPLYKVSRSTRAGGPYTLLATVNTANYVDTQINNNSTFYYVVAATNNTGTSLNTAEVSAAVTVTAPSTPTSLSATPALSEITLSWTGSASDLTYNIYRSTVRNGPYALIKNNVRSSPYIDKTAVNDTPYYYVVQAANPAGVSGYSNEASSVAKDVPGAPTKLVVAWQPGVCGGNPGAVLTWSAPSYYKAFDIFLGGVSGAENYLASTNATTYTFCSSYDLDLQFNIDTSINAYYFQVAGNWGSDKGAMSNEVGAYKLQPTVTANPGNTQMNLVWSNTGPAINYLVKRSLTQGGPYTQIASLNSTTFTDSAVTNGTAYYYEVTPEYVTNSQYGVPSVEVGGVPGPNPSAPSTLTLVPATTGINLFWTAPSQYNAFNVYTAGAAGGPWTLKYTSSNPALNYYSDLFPAAGMNFYKVTARWGQSYETAASNVVSFRNGVPTTISILQASSTSNQIIWNAVTGASSYTLLRSTTSKGPYSTVNANAVSPYTDSGLALNTGYYYVVYATFPDLSVGRYSAEVSMTTGTTAVPGGVTVVGQTGGSVSLSWSLIAGATKYKVYYATVSGGPYATPLTFNGPPATVPGLNSNTTYYFGITSVKAAESTKSADLAVKTYSTPGTPLLAAGNGSVQVSFAGVTGALSYNVQRSTDGINFSTITNTTSYNYLDSGLTNGNIYFYRVAGVFPSSLILYSANSLSVTPGVTPLAPGGITAIGNTTGTDLTFAWASVSGATNYNIYSYSGGTYTLIGNSSANSFTMSGLTEGTAYSIAVSALNGTNESGYSAVGTAVAVSTQAAPAVTIVPTNTAQITWAAVSGATSYNVERSTDTLVFTSIATNNVSTSFNDSTLVAGQAYVYRFMPVFAGGNLGSYSQVSTAVTAGNNPLAPSKLAADTDGTTVTLSWVPSPNILSYNIYRASATGGPYALIDNVADPTTTYVDSTVSAGNSYFYVVSSVNDSGVNSVYSNEAGVSLTASPAGLAGVPSNQKISLSWNAVGSASGYRLKKGLSAAGPFTVIYSGALLAYPDVQIQNGVTYFYTVDALFPSGIASPNANPISVLGQASANLSVPIELTDQALQSDVVQVAYDRTQTSFDPNDYDGTVTYQLEAVAVNADSVPLKVNLIDSSSGVVGSLTVPSGTASPTRIRATISLNSTADVYRLSLDPSNSAGLLQVFSSRLWVNQIGATITKIYIPLLSLNVPPNGADRAAPILATTSTSYLSGPNASIFTRNTSAYSNLDTYNPWELEAVVAATTGTTGAISLIDTNTNSVVQDSETVFNETNPTLTSIPIEEGVTNFDSSTEGHAFQVGVQCYLNCPSNVFLYKAGLWISLSDVSKAEVILRNTLGYDSPSTLMDLTESRERVITTAYSNPTVYFQATATAPSGGSLFVQLMTSGGADSGVAGLAAVAGSSLTFNANQSTQIRTASPITLTSGNRYLTEVNPSVPGGELSDAQIVIQVQR